MENERYRVGWNDLVYGIHNWSPAVDCKRWPTPLAWALHCKGVAEATRPEAHGHNVAYYDGVIDAAVEYQRTGAIARKEKPR